MNRPMPSSSAASNFSFLRGASHPEELAATASVLGLAGFAIADRNTLAGIVRGHLAAKTTGARYAVGCRLAFRDGTPDIAVWPTDRAAYGRLCRLLTDRQSPHQGRASAISTSPTSLNGGRDWRWPCCRARALPSLLAGEGQGGGRRQLRRPPSPPEGEGVASTCRRGGRGRGLRFRVSSQSQNSPSPRRLRRPPSPSRVEGWQIADLAGANSRHSRRSLPRPRASRRHLPLSRRRPTPARSGRRTRRRATKFPCSRSATCSITRRSGESCRTCSPASASSRTLETAGRLLEANAERHMKSAAEMARLFAEYPQAITETLAVFERLAFSLEEISHDYEYPLESAGESATTFDELVRLTWLGADWRYPEGVPDERQEPHRARACDHQGPEIRGLFPHRPQHHGVRALTRASSARAAVRRRIPPSATACASPTWIRSAAIFSSSASSRATATSRPTSTSISSTSGARR